MKINESNRAEGPCYGPGSTADQVRAARGGTCLECVGSTWAENGEMHSGTRAGTVLHILSRDNAEMVQGSPRSPSRDERDGRE